MKMSNSVITNSDELSASYLNSLHGGTAITLMNSVADIDTSRFQHLRGLAGPAIFSHHNQYIQNQRFYLNVNQSSFVQNTAQYQGGSIVTYDVDTTIRNSIFLVNSVIKVSGGASSLQCSTENIDIKSFSFKIIECVYVIIGNQFSQNDASTTGGAIEYNLFSPLGL